MVIFSDRLLGSIKISFLHTGQDGLTSSDFFMHWLQNVWPHIKLVGFKKMLLQIMQVSSSAN